MLDQTKDERTPIEKVLDDATGGFKKMYGREPDDGERTDLAKAAQAVVGIKKDRNRHPPNRIRRRAALTIAVATKKDSVWRNRLYHYYNEDIHFVVHCLLAEHEKGAVLRRQYGVWTPSMTPREVEQKSIPIVEDGEGGRSSIPGVWPMDHFSPMEAASYGLYPDHGKGRHARLFLAPAMLTFPEVFRHKMGDAPVTVNSWYRCREHNARVGGALKSRHLHGDAMDISMANHNGARAVDAIAEILGADGAYGLGEYPPPHDDRNMIHVDMRGEKRRWGTSGKWPDETFTPSDRLQTAGKQKRTTAIVAGGGAAAAAHQAGVEVQRRIEDIEVTDHLDTIEHMLGSWERIAHLGSGLIGAGVVIWIAYENWAWIRHKWAIWVHDTLSDAFPFYRKMMK